MKPEIATIVMAFSSDPIARWVWPDSAAYLEHCPRFIEAFGGKAFEHNTAYYAPEGGAALWLPPGVEPDQEAMAEIMQTTVDAKRQVEMDGFFEQMAQNHPTGPHWYLPVIGVDPPKQGQGIGSKLMRQALERCDRDGLPAYLESSNPRNISLYERHGFKIVGKIQSGSSPEMFPMLREPIT